MTTLLGIFTARPILTQSDEVSTVAQSVDGCMKISLVRGLEPDSKAGELALLLIRCYRSLYALVGGGTDDIRHWMQTPVD